MTDDSDAERSALKRVWPESNQLLCTFHVAQAVWRWLWDSKHAIKKDHRKVLMAMFQRVMYAKSDCDAEQKFSLLVEDETAKMYPCFQKHVQKYWIRKKLWCFAYRRFSQLRGHHTNNFSEVSVRIYKDIVLCRCKAYNAVSLVDFTCTVLEDYYRKRLLDFAHGRNVHSHLLADKVLQRSAYLNKSMIEQISESQFRVPSEKAPENMYDVDVNSGICSCESGAFGGFCKHQSAVMKFFGTENSNAPAVSANSRHIAAIIALGDGAQPRTFYAPLNDAVSRNEKPMIFENITQVVDSVVDAESSTFVGITDAEIEAAVNALRSGLEKHRNDPSVKNGMLPNYNKMQAVSVHCCLVKKLIYAFIHAQKFEFNQLQLLVAVKALLEAPKELLLEGLHKLRRKLQHQNEKDVCQLIKLQMSLILSRMVLAIDYK